MRLCTLWLAFSLSIIGAVAHAQTPTPQAPPETPGATATHDVAPVGLQSLRPTESAFPLPDFNALEAGYVPPPPPRRPAHWTHTTALGASLGLGAPYGYAGAFVAYNPALWGQLEVGAGYSVPFGPSVGFMGRLGIDPGNDSMASVGFGISANFTDFDYVTNCSFSGSRETCSPSGTHRNARGTANPIYLNFEIAEDLRTASDFGTRFAIGFALLTNPGGFPAVVGCPNNAVGRTPCDVALANTNDKVSWQVYAHLDLYYLVVNGLAGASSTARPANAH